MNSNLLQLLIASISANSALSAALLELQNDQSTPAAPVPVSNVVPLAVPSFVPPAPVAASPAFAPPAPAATPSFQSAFVPPPAPVAPVAPVSAATGCPITDSKALVAYVMEAYGQLGATKGPSMQAILSACHVTNINEVTPDKFSYIWSNIEALKVA